jgi:hypothetical protein
MIDVHPPHEATHTWKDFFIHIATIVVGLLIAIGLEQTVEFVHHRHQLAEVRAALGHERDINLDHIEENRGLTARMEAYLAEDAQLLERRAAGDRSPLAGKLKYAFEIEALTDAAWQTATESAVLGLMTDGERERYAHHYRMIDYYEATLRDLASPQDRAAAIVRDKPDGNFSEEDTRELIEATHEAQGKLVQTESFLRIVGDSSQ